MSTPDCIYIVEGGYSDWESSASWCVAAYLEEEPAKRHAEQAQKHAIGVLKKYARAYAKWLNSDNHGHGYPDISDYACDLDRGIHSDGRSEIYYRVISVPIRTEPPVITRNKS